MQMAAFMKATGSMADKVATEFSRALKEQNTMETGTTIFSTVRAKSAGQTVQSTLVSLSVGKRQARVCSVGPMDRPIRVRCWTAGSMDMVFTLGRKKDEYTLAIGLEITCTAKVA